MHRQPFNKSWNRRHCLLSLAAALALAGCGGADTPPDVGYTLLDGRQTTLHAQRGKVLLVNFWATSCTTCVAEMPHLIANHQALKGKPFDTLAVAMSYDPPDYVAEFAKTRALPFGVAIDNTGKVAEAFGGVKLTPTTFLLDPQGRIVKRYVGQPDFDALRREIDQLLPKA
ncbi:MAG: TlpA family protein disulfide reductase [Proteobacteria bacterium]|nr:TlpA family protein disulfide reductase [Pseudomonadota bacterium]